MEAKGYGSGAGQADAIERLVESAFEAGVIAQYRPIDEEERAELAKKEKDEISRAYFVEMDGAYYYITYKPQIKRSPGSKLQHVNRSTPFVETLLNKIGTQYSFLYCRSTVTDFKLFGAPPCVPGFTCGQPTREQIEGKNKYELHFLIECLDNIEANERLSNRIESVLLDVDGDDTDYFAPGKMRYAKLKREETESTAVPVVDPAVRRQLSDIVNRIREQSSVRQRILDFLLQNGSDLAQYARDRDQRLFAELNGRPEPESPEKGKMICRLMPIGVFLNAIDNFRLTYEITGSTGEHASFSVEVNPTTPVGYTCPHCGAPLTDDSLVVASGEGGQAVGCTRCAARCAYDGCERWVFVDAGCAVCGMPYCPSHSAGCCVTGSALCTDCAAVFRTADGRPLAPEAAAVPGQPVDLVSRAVAEGRDDPAALRARFRKLTLTPVTDCFDCDTPEGRKYYKKEDTTLCDQCGKRYFTGDVRPVGKDRKRLCFHDRVDCRCGNVVEVAEAVRCSEPGCTVGYCQKCKTVDGARLTYAEALRYKGSGSRPVLLDGEVYCADHFAVCKVCGKAFPLDKGQTCMVCGGIYCPDCGAGARCATCSMAAQVDASDIRPRAFKGNAARFNALPLPVKWLGKTAVFEDKRHVVFVRPGKTVLYDKLTGTKRREKGGIR